MAQIILHKNGAFNIYSTIADGAIFDSAITEDELTRYIKEESGNRGVNALPDRISRAKEKGTSGLISDDLESEIICNRAGDNEDNLSLDEFIRRFLTLAA